MRDVSAKVNTLRVAKARAMLRASGSTIEAIRGDRVPKGDPLAVAKVAAVQAAKNTPQMIPYCHPVPVDFVGVEFTLENERIVVEVEVKAIYKTGVEMEALSAASVAVLTLYDMLKMLDEHMSIEAVELLSKKGGKSGFAETLDAPARAAVLVLSDSVSAGKSSDVSGKLLVDALKANGLSVTACEIVPDEPEAIEQQLLQWIDRQQLDLIVTTGGTGLGPRDCTPQVVSRLCDREVPGIAEAIRNYGQQRLPQAMLSQSVAGVRAQTLLISLPGSPGGVRDALAVLLPVVVHALNIIRGAGHHTVNSRANLSGT